MASLMVLHVTLEQRTAVKNLFDSKSWAFQTLESRLSSELQEMIVASCRLPQFIDSSLLESTELESAMGTDGIQNGNHSNKLKVQPSKSTTSLEQEHQFADLSTRCLRKRKQELQKKIEPKASTDSIADDNVIHQNKHNNKVSRSPCSEISSSPKIILESVLISNNMNKETKVPDAQKLPESRRTMVAEFDGCKQAVQFKKGNSKIKDKLNCEKCNYVTNIQSNLNRHLIEVHGGIRNKCPKCDKSFKSSYEASMHKHLAHSTGPQCSNCDRIFTSTSGLRNHIKTKHENKTLYQCSFCTMTFFYKTQFNGHVNKHLNLKPFVCQQCQKPFRYKRACKLHEKSCLGETVNAALSVVKSTKPKWLCDVCGAELGSKSSMKMHHLYVHSDDTRAVCSQCGKSFKGAYSLRRHMKTVHEDDGIRHPCTVCGKQFVQVQILKQHMKIHQKAYTSFCDTCGKGFLSQFKMLEHSRSHSGIKPFSCPVCLTFKCATKTNLRKHIHRHDNGKTVEQEFSDRTTLNRQNVEVGSKLRMTADRHKKTKESDTLEKQDLINNMKFLKTMNSTNKLKHCISISASNVPEQSDYSASLKQYSLFSEKSCVEPGSNYVKTDFINKETNVYSVESEVASQRLGDISSFGSNFQSLETGTRIRRYCDVTCGDENNIDLRNSKNNEQNSDTSEYSQGLNILTVALNMINPP